MEISESTEMHFFQLVLYIQEHPSSLYLVSAKAASIRKAENIQCAAPSREHVLKTEGNKILAEGKEELTIARSPGGRFAGGLSVGTRAYLHPLVTNCILLAPMCTLVLKYPFTIKRM